jgi:hypothetical protein
MIQTKTVYVADGVTSDYAVPFTYRTTDEVTVTLSLYLPTYSGYFFVNPGLIRFNGVPPIAGVNITIERSTDITSPDVVFQNASTSTGKQVNAQILQLIQALQEAKYGVTILFDDALLIGGNGKYDAKTREIENVATAVGALSAVPYGQMATYVQTQIQAVASGGFTPSFRGPFNNIAISADGLSVIGSGIENISIGTGAMPNAINVSSRIAIGWRSGNAVTTADSFVAMGTEAGRDTTTSHGCTYIGHVAGRRMTSGNSNTFVGGFCGTGNSLAAAGSFTGFNNSGVGEACLLNLTSGGSNIAMGFNAGFGLQSGSNNVLLGNGSGEFIVTTSNNTAVGFTSYGFGAGDQNTFVGYRSGYGNTISTTTSATHSTGSAVATLTSVAGIIAGAKFYSPSYQGHVGLVTVLSVDATAKTVTLDVVAETDTPSGFPVTVVNSVHSGTGNVGIGAQALNNISGDADFNVSLGFLSGSLLGDGDSNIFIGNSAGDNIVTGSNNLMIGANVDAPSSTSSNTMNIMNLVYGTGLLGVSGKIGVGNGNNAPTATFDVKGNVGITNTTSSPFNGASATQVIGPNGTHRTMLITLADDTAGYLTLPANARAIVELCCNGVPSATSPSGRAWVNVASGGSVVIPTNWFNDTTNVVLTTGVLAGTTSTDAKLSISVDSASSRVYIENRLGLSKTFGITVTSSTI